MIARILSFAKNPAGAGVLFLVTAFTFFYFVREYRERKERSSGSGAANVLPRMSPEETHLSPRETIVSEWVAGGTLEKFSPPEDPPQPVAPPPAAPNAVASTPAELPALLHVYRAPHETAPEPEPLKPPRIFAPAGTLVPCQLVVTLDSSSLETPVVGFVTGDIWNNGTLIIPAGTEVHSFAARGRVRDRVAVSGQWKFVWQDGREVRVNGIALDREHDPEKDTYGITDGSAGIRGDIHKSDEFLEFKLFASTAIGAVAKSAESTTRTVFGDFERNSLGNAGLEGVSAVTERYAKLLLDQVDGDGLFVRAPAGTEFYVYTLQTFEPELASVAGLEQGQRPTNSWEKRTPPPTPAAPGGDLGGDLTKALDDRERLERAIRLQKTAKLPRNTDEN